MKRILLAAGGILAVLVIAIAVLPFLIPSSVYKAQIEKAASDALGRDVTIAGDARLSIFPVISASVENVSVANPDGFDEPHMIEASALRGSVRLFPLFARRVEVNELTFEDASVRLTRLPDGNVNWALTGAEEKPAEDQPIKSGGDPFAASINRASLRNASLIFDDQQAGTRYALTELDADTSLTSADRPLNVRARGKFQSEAFELNISLTTPQTLVDGAETAIDARLGSNLANISFDGRLTPSEPMMVSGQFSADLPNLGKLSDFLSIPLPINAQPLGGLRASGTVDGELASPGIQFSELVLAGEGLNANYTGGVSFEGVPSFEGSLSIAIRDAYALSKDLGLDQVALQPLRQISADTKLQGPATAIVLSGMEVKATSPTLSASYSGLLSADGGGNFDGNLSIESDHLRTLLSQVGMDMPPGDDLKAASLAGRLTGTFQRISVQSGSFSLDDARATGNLSADIGTSKPTVRADLALPRLDLSSFLSTGGDTPPADDTNSGRWSDDRLDLAALNALDADLNLQAGEIVLGDIILRNSDMKVGLKKGKLIANLNEVSAFGGDWTGNATIDASLARPSFQFQLAANSVQAQELLSTTAGFDRLSGKGVLNVDVSSNGGSIKEIVSSMSGTLALDLDDGALAGINLGQLVRTTASLQQLITSGELTAQSLGGVVSPQSQTDFTTFKAVLSVTDGVAQIQNLALANSVLDVKGTGKINLGRQSLDVRLVPSVDRSGAGTSTSSVQINGIPVPLRVHGDWLAPQFSPDISAIRSSLSSQARDKAASELEDAIGGDLGAIVSEAITGRKPTAPATGTTQPPAEQPDAETTPEEVSDGTQTDQEPETPEDPQESEEDAREKALKQVLGTIFNPKE